jgi:hypothetical protein
LLDVDLTVEDVVVDAGEVIGEIINEVVLEVFLQETALQLRKQINVALLTVACL